MELLKTLIITSEKASNIARLLRNNDKIFQKLIEEKSNNEANNKRFQQDFKTLTDVLIQEMVKYDLGKKFPELENKIYGEENNKFFSKALNEDIIVEIKNSEDETALLLNQVLEDEEVSLLLAKEVHKNLNLDDINTEKNIPDEISIDINNLSIWIDPIDATNEYVKGELSENKINQIYVKGLKCVTVLIGVYNLQGEPVIGVINQPFFEKHTDEGFQCNWGINYANYSINSVNSSEWQKTGNILVGASEREEIKHAIKDAGFNLITSNGAGYKLLMVVLGFADAYILSKSTTFFWDTCAPHAILKSLGDGNICEMVEIMKQQKKILTYKPKNGNSKCNTNGIVAYRNEEIFEKLLKINWMEYLCNND